MPLSLRDSLTLTLPPSEPAATVSSEQRDELGYLLLELLLLLPLVLSLLLGVASLDELDVLLLVKLE